jgi:hypothetical protein
MSSWLMLTGGLLVWAAHFFGVYAIVSIFPSSTTSYWLAAIWTLPCLAADIWLLLYLWRLRRAGSDWTCFIGLTAASFSIVAILWQALPIAFY